jgi:hypothetical protein
MNKYELLTKHLIEAKEFAVKDINSIDDGGSANLDSTFLTLKGWRENNVLDAITKAGLYCRCKSKWSWMGSGYFISINVGQGNKRTVARDRFKSYLNDLGYDVVGYDKMD